MTKEINIRQIANKKGCNIVLDFGESKKKLINPNKIFGNKEKFDY
jgi:hypothetical protein